MLVAITHSLPIESIPTEDKRLEMKNEFVFLTIFEKRFKRKIRGYYSCDIMIGMNIEILHN